MFTFQKEGISLVISLKLLNQDPAFYDQWGIFVIIITQVKWEQNIWLVFVSFKRQTIVITTLYPHSIEIAEVFLKHFQDENCIESKTFDRES